MDNINYIYIIPLVITIAVFFFTFIKGKNTTQYVNSKYLILFSVLSILISTIVISKYYEIQFNEETKKFNEILNAKEVNDSIKNDIDSRVKQLQLLKKQNKELDEILKKINEQEKIIGKKPNIKNSIANKIKTNKIEIGEIEKYNNLLNEKVLDNRSGYKASGNTSSFIFDCPTDYESETLDLKLKFTDEKIISEIEYIYISFYEKIKDNNYNMLFEQVYEPQVGVNGFKVKNYFKTNKKVNLDVGYVLKSESNKKYPNMERIICRNY